MSYDEDTSDIVLLARIVQELKLTIERVAQLEEQFFDCLADFNRIEAMMRANRIHEPSCALVAGFHLEDYMADAHKPIPDCDCWLSK